MSKTEVQLGDIRGVEADRIENGLVHVPAEYEDKIGVVFVVDDDSKIIAENLDLEV